MTSQHSSDGYSPLFSNAGVDHASPVEHRNDPSSAQKRSEPNGDHHLTFLDPTDSTDSRAERR